MASRVPVGSPNPRPRTVGAAASVAAMSCPSTLRSTARSTRLVTRSGSCRCTRTPTTRRRRVRARSRATPPRHPRRAGVLHRRRGRRHPQPGGRHARGRAPTCARCAWRSCAPASTRIGYAELYLLGYRDSGMPDTEANARPDNFANAPLDEAVGRLVRDHPRASSPQVIDHLRRRAARSTRTPTTSGCTRSRCRRSTPPAIPTAYPDAGEPWQPSKLYYSGFSFRRIQALHDAYEQIGEESPYAERIAQFEERRGRAERPITPPTTLVDVGDFLRRPAAGAARAPHADRSRELLDAGARRPPARDVPVGGVRAGPLAGARSSPMPTRRRARARPLRRRARPRARPRPT